MISILIQKITRKCFERIAVKVSIQLFSLQIDTIFIKVMDIRDFFKEIKCISGILNSNCWSVYVLITTIRRRLFKHDIRP